MTGIVPKPGFRMQKLWAFVAIDADGDEGLIGAKTAGGWMPLVGADEARTKSLRDLAQRIATQDGTRVELREFSTMKTVEVIEP